MNKTLIEENTKTVNRTVSRETFIQMMADFAGCVWEFHKYWNAGSNNPYYNDWGSWDIARDRLTMLEEEFEEHESAYDEANALEELADVLYVAMGTVEAVGSPALEAMQMVGRKNYEKNRLTHQISSKTGKIVRKPCIKS